MIAGVLSVLLDETMVLSEASFFSSNNLLFVSLEIKLSFLVSKDGFSDLTAKVALLLLLRGYFISLLPGEVASIEIFEGVVG